MTEEEDKHMDEWKRIKAYFNSQSQVPNDVWHYKSRCVGGLISGETLDYN